MTIYSPLLIVNNNHGTSGDLWNQIAIGFGVFALIYIFTSWMKRK
jgi:hypothetical protein